jgi:hypothetical protein
MGHLDRLAIRRAVKLSYAFPHPHTAMLASRLTTILAVGVAAVFWIYIADYAGGGDSGDQLIKLGVAGAAICVAVPLAGVSLGLLAWEHFRKRSRTAVTLVLALLNLLVIASLLMCLA